MNVRSVDSPVTLTNLLASINNLTSGPTFGTISTENVPVKWRWKFSIIFHSYNIAVVRMLLTCDILENTDCVWWCVLLSHHFSKMTVFRVIFEYRSHLFNNYWYMKILQDLNYHCLAFKKSFEDFNVLLSLSCAEICVESCIINVYIGMSENTDRPFVVLETCGVYFSIDLGISICFWSAKKGGECLLQPTTFPFATFSSLFSIDLEAFIPRHEEWDSREKKEYRNCFLLIQ